MQGQIFNIESEAPELKDGSETSSGGMKVVLEASLAQDTAVVLTFRLFDSTLGNKSRTKKWKVEEKRDLEEAMVEGEAVMEGEVEAGEEVTVEVAEVEGEDMAVEEAAEVTDEAVATAAKVVAVEAPNAIGAQYRWRRARRLM